MTGNISNREGRVGTVTLSSRAPEMVSYGPQDMQRDPAGRLYDDKVGSGRVFARGEGFLSIAGTIGKKIADAVKGTVTRYTRPSFARARADDYATARIEGFGYTELPFPGEIAPTVPGSDGGLRRYFPKIRKATQSWLRYITGKSEHVYGAAVPDGPDEGTYIDTTLFEKADQYIRRVGRGARDTVQNAKSLINALVTGYHENKHWNGETDENRAEQYGWNQVSNLAERGDKLVRYALGKVFGTSYFQPELVPLGIEGQGYRTR